jgi:CRP-like cAMP-binding protein
MHYIGTADAKGDSELLVWEHARIRRLAEKYPRLAENALGIVLRYLSAHTDRLVDLITLNAAQRLARVLFHLGEQTGKIHPTGVEIEATNEEFADLANVSTFTASRLLNKWAREGIVAKSRGKVFLYSPEKLLNHD